MSDRLRQALDYESGEFVDHPGGDTWEIIRAAARRFLALTETGRRVEWCETHQVDQSVRWPKWCDYYEENCSIVSAYVIPADYLTEDS